MEKEAAEERQRDMTSLFWKRRRVLVDRFQYRLIWISAGHFALVLFVFLAAMMTPLLIKLDDEGATFIEKDRVADVLLFFHEQLWLPLIAVFLLLLIHSLSVSHRIAGPLYRFRAVYKTLSEGDLAIRANIRKNDYLHADARALNEMIQALQTRVGGLEGQVRQLKEEAAQVTASANAGSNADVRKAAERVESRLEDLRGQLAGLAKNT